MSSNLEDAVVLITSYTTENKHFGTGFVIYRDQKGTYFLTCGHVVEDVGGSNEVRVNGFTAKVVASGIEKGIDLAVLCIEDIFDWPTLKLQAHGRKGSPFITAGFQEHGGKHYLIRTIEGNLGRQVELVFKGQPNRIKAWDLKTIEEYHLQPGYSGSPVVSRNKVLAIVNHRQGKSEKGLAISIEALKDVWFEMPTDLLNESKVDKVDYFSTQQTTQQHKKSGNLAVRSNKLASNNSLGPYKICKAIGKGGFATVYLAEDISLNRQVAIKELSPEKNQRDEFVKRFKREAKALARLNHPNIVRIYEFYELEGKFHIVMEYLPGGSLQDFINKQYKGGLPIEKVFIFLEQLASALDYAHSQKMIHRDIKPNNVLLDDAENPQQVILTDFGLVKFPASTEVLTATGDVLGTYGYIAPEQFAHDKAGIIGPASDIYSLSILAYQMFTGERPIPFHRPRNPIELNPELGQTIAMALLKGLEENPKDRPATAGEFVSMLRTGKKQNILVVDDEKNIRRTIKYLLEKKNYIVELADGVDDALEKLRRKRFDLIVVDLNMGLDERAGFKLLDKVNQLNEQSQLLKIILTARYDMESVMEGYDYDVEAYIPKDQNMELNLLTKISRILNKIV